ncbi:hypothetical protein JXA56_03680 [Candidatus Micrarchaeota archaeon]|nr:hypothetical protein [Candidatus Micrarchaeota archaeon]
MDIEKFGMEVIETHISWILLGEYAYKIKKPVRLTFLDFSTLKKRKFFCEEEVRLNRRLSPDIYLGVVSITEQGLEKEGKPVEYAVKMKRLDNKKKMDNMLSEGKITERHVRKIAEIVAGFHGKIESAGGYTPEIVWNQIKDLENYKKTIESASGLGEKVDPVLEKCRIFIEKNRELMVRRAMEGKVKDCHGDLHSGNIFIVNGIRIIDGIEFSRQFRCVDVASEIAFMAMDLDAFGREDLSRAFVEEYVNKTGDLELRPLLNLYKCYRANVRAKVAAIDYSQHPGHEPRKMIGKYILLAEKYAKQL